MASTKKATAKVTAPVTEKKVRVPDEKKYHARLSLYGLPSMDKRGVKNVTKWLRALADGIEKEPKAYHTRFIARLMK